MVAINLDVENYPVPVEYHDAGGPRKDEYGRKIPGTDGSEKRKIFDAVIREERMIHLKKRLSVIQHANDAAVVDPAGVE